jgi:hypothetical protein
MSPETNPACHTHLLLPFDITVAAPMAASITPLLLAKLATAYDLTISAPMSLSTVGKLAGSGSTR